MDKYEDLNKLAMKYFDELQKRKPRFISRPPGKLVAFELIGYLKYLEELGYFDQKTEGEQK